MVHISADQFNRFAEAGYNRIPVVREILADLDTPLSAYMKVANAPYTYLLESVQGGEKWGRYSIIGLPATQVVRVSGNRMTVTENGVTVLDKECSDPLTEIDAFQQQFRVPDISGLPRVTGGLVGYFGYDCVRYIEPRLQGAQKADPLACPDILLLVSDRAVIFDNISGKLLLIIHADPARGDAYALAQGELDALADRLLHTTVTGESNAAPRHINEEDFVSGMSRKRFEQAVDTIKEYIVEGDAMQVVLSQRLSIPFHAPPLNLYRALRCTNPSPYMFYFDFEEFHVVGTSPEILVRVEEGIATVRPIAGTRPRGVDEEEDRAMEEDLLSDPKELAEHLMLIDLGRNDIGRVAEIGSVRLTEKMIIERYSHVMHIVSNVTGRIRPGLNAIDVLRATFPAGTLSGAPKIRAMEIIDELEPVKRGVYGGAVGYLSWSGNMDTAIAIRTAVIRDRTLHIQAGAGIVADSVPASEWEETMNKGRAIFRAVIMAEHGLNSPK